MNVRGFLAVAALAITTLTPLASIAQTAPAPAGGMGGAMGDMKPPTKDQIKTALKATNPSIRQLRALKPMMSNYQSQVESAPDQTSKRAATKQLVAGMKTVLSPEQQSAFKQSLMSQMMASH